jgi:hypothetical protein
MARLPTPRNAAVFGHGRWATASDLHFLARLDWQLPEHPMVCAGARHYSPWVEYRACIHVVPGEATALLLFPCRADGFLESYIIDTYLMYSASALAANMMVRSAVGAIFPLFTDRMFEEMGVNWACTLIGGIAFFLAPMPFVFFKYGPRIRQKSKFAPCVVRPYFSEAVSSTMLISFDLRILR